LADFENTYHFLLVSDMEHRIEFLQGYYEQTASKAETAIKAGEKKRTILYKRMRKENYDSPSHYHLVLNMSKLSLDDALKLVCALVKNP